MKSALLCGCIAVFLLSCSEDPAVPETKTVAREDIIGVWRRSIPPMPGVSTDSIHFKMDMVDPQDAYEIRVRRDQQLIFVHAGTWELHADSVRLTGVNCEVLDTSSQQIVPFECGPNVELPVDIDSRGQWKVSGAMLSPVAAQLLGESIAGMMTGLVLELVRD